MKILLPNAKEMNTNLDPQAFQTLQPASQQVLESLLTMTKEDLAKFYKIKLDKAQLEWDRWQRIASGQAKTYPAWQLYDGLMYRYMKRTDLTEAEVDYLRKNAFITTGFYGVINVFDLISPHRLDFQGSLKVAGKSLKQFWRQQFDQVIGDDEYFVSLMSSEFEAVFSPSVQARMIKLIFMEEKNGQRKIHSTISKKGRGRFLSLMAEKNVETIDQIKTLSIDGFVYQADLSKEQELVFVRPATN
ncbi:peroxide stress protein YaaA [Streptococcus gallolyticus]|uniref:peroxide stress protein YaaA n=1 Tax=Streptococcus hepaticus TaxID=3349163 RepID=UPI001C97E592|nr:peroxide stress protein YaaA [Streptococcus gallolyticus]MBY5041642.1 peroxide stress protein YaaA [Streptococcus gallolyticus]